jgi:hypothetical protein
MSYATLAVAAERKGDFRRAAELWQTVSTLARYPVNADWAVTRADFCRVAVSRGWEGADER